MMMSPLKVRTVKVALPSPNVPRVERPGPGRRRPSTAVVGPIVRGRSDRIEPLKVFALSSNPTSLDSVSRTVPECELISYRPFFKSTPEYSTFPLTDRTPSANREEILSGLSGHVCRCTGYIKIVSAVEAAAKGDVHPDKVEPSFEPEEAAVLIPGSPA